jgi:hypothetical protein
MPAWVWHTSASGARAACRVIIKVIKAFQVLVQVRRIVCI